MYVEMFISRACRTYVLYSNVRYVVSIIWGWGQIEMYVVLL